MSYTYYLIVSQTQVDKSLEKVYSVYIKCNHLLPCAITFYTVNLENVLKTIHNK